MIPLILAIVFLPSTLRITASVVRAESMLLKEEVPGTDYCHLKFPAIREDTLSSDRPVLKSSDTSDIIDYYGPCDFDPTGERAVWMQSWEETREVFADGE